MSDLAKRLLACPRFRWMPGMRTGDQRIVACDPNSSDVCTADEGCTEGGYSVWWVKPQYLWPDLTDPATIGLLEYLAREAYKDEDLYCAPVDEDRSWWGIFSASAPRGLGGKSRAEALVAALEAA